MAVGEEAARLHPAGLAQPRSCPRHCSCPPPWQGLISEEACPLEFLLLQVTGDH